MTACLRRMAPLLALLALSIATPHAQSAHGPHRAAAVSPDVLTRPVPLRTGIGHASEAIATTNPQAQAFYNQGLEYLHSYVWVEAARSFNQALRLDANIPLAYIGLSYADVELNDSSAAHAALARGEQLAAKGTSRDRTRIDLRAKQMAAEDNVSDASLLTVYRRALDSALAQDPRDVELWLLRGVAESPDPGERGQGSPASSIPFYEKALALAPNDDAAHHFLTHAYENSGRDAEAQKEASTYAAMAPGIPHAHHMLGHVLERSGKMSEAIAAFEAADRLERAYLSSASVAPEHDWDFEHNLDLLGAAYEYVGRMKSAEHVLREAFDLPTALVEEGFNKRNWPEFLIARGRAPEAASAAVILTELPSALVTATGHLERAHALMWMKDLAGAAQQSNAALGDMRTAANGAALVAKAAREVQGEFLLRTKESTRGRTMLEQFVRDLRATPGPDTWIDGLFALEDIAKTGRAIGDWPLAAWAAEEMLEYDPNYGGTHFALALQAEHEKNFPRAHAEFATASRAWAGADPDFAELLIAREKSR